MTQGNRGIKNEEKLFFIVLWKKVMRINYSAVIFGFVQFKWEKRRARDRRDSTMKGEIMKKMLLSIALAVVAPFAWGQVSETTTTTTTTEGNGTITEYTPGSAIVLRETSGPVRYRFGKTVTYVTRSGRV